MLKPTTASLPPTLARFMSNDRTTTDCAAKLKALADDDRLRLVQLLRAGPANVSELTARHGGDIANVSHHLQILLREGIVQRKRQGRFLIYALHPDVCAASPEASEHLDLGCCRLELPKEW